MGADVIFEYVLLKGGRPVRKLADLRTAQKYLGRGAMDKPYGSILIAKPLSVETEYLPQGPSCLDGYNIANSDTSKGWGPLLYEIALEWSSQRGGGLTSDRLSVSLAAASVWEKYLVRPDVEKKQLDVDMPDEFEPPLSQLTPDIKVDDCEQYKAVDVGGHEGWMDTPFAKMYYKPTTEVIDMLKQEGRLFEQ